MLLPGQPRQFQRAHRHRIFAQPRQSDSRPGGEGLHHKGRQGALDGRAQWLADARQAPAQDYSFRMKQMHNMGEPKRQILRCLLQKPPGGRIPLPPSRGQMLRFPANRLAGQPSQRALRLSDTQLADSGVHRPPGAARFDNRPVPVQPHVADLRLSGLRAMINPAVHHQSATDAAAERDVKDRVKTHAGPVNRFPQSRYVRIVIHHYRGASHLSKPAAQVKFRPALNLV